MNLILKESTPRDHVLTEIFDENVSVSIHKQTYKQISIVFTVIVNLEIM